MAGRKLRLAVWNARAALLYSLGGWTILGGMLHYTMHHGESGDASAWQWFKVAPGDVHTGIRKHFFIERVVDAPSPSVFIWAMPLITFENKSDPQAKPGPRQEIHTRETALGFTVTTVATYREVEPPITRLLRRVKSYIYPDDSPPPEN